MKSRSFTFHPRKAEPLRALMAVIGKLFRGGGALFPMCSVQKVFTRTSELRQ